jgi:hypothetical protein
MQDEKEALMVTYTSGGSTPGDSYVWILDELCPERMENVGEYFL